MTTYQFMEHQNVELNLLLLDVSLFKTHSSKAIDRSIYVLTYAFNMH